MPIPPRLKQPEVRPLRSSSVLTAAMLALVFHLGSAAIGGCALGPRIPSGIHYVRASHEQNEQARRLIRKVFLQDSSINAELIGSGLIVAPGYWNAIGSKYEGRGCLVTRAETPTPFDEGGSRRLEGAYLTGCQPIADLLRRLVGPGKHRRVVIRKLTPRELVLHWGMFPWEMAEPLYVAEVEGRRILFDFLEMDGRLRIRSIDEINAYRMLGVPVGR